MGAFAYENTSSGSFSNLVYRGQTDESNTPIYEEVNRDDYIVPPSDNYHLRLTGFTEPYTDAIPVEFQKENGPTTRKATNLELEIVSGPGAGKRFLWSFITMSLSMGKNPSHWGRIYKAGVLKGGDPPEGTQLFYDDTIGAEFMAYVNASAATRPDGRPKFATLSKDTIKPVPAEGAPKYNPFEQPFDEAKATA